MSDEDHKEILIVRRHAGHEDIHHGGAWKIAFADFMTAMMALFLVLWLISSTSEKTKQTVAQYFNPVKLVDMSTLRKGFRDPKETEMSSGASPAELKIKEETGKPKAPAVKSQGAAVQSGQKPSAEGESQLFRDPYAVLAEIAASAPLRSSQPSAAAAENMKATESGQAFLDPFATIPRALDAPERQFRSLESISQSRLHEAAGGAGANNSITGKAADAPLSDGGRAGDQQTQAQLLTSEEAKGPQVQANDAARLKAELFEAIGGTADEKNKPRIDVQDVEEGVLISLTDDANFSMFAVGSAEPSRQTVQIMEKVGRLIKAGSNPVVIRGHTDGRPYRSAVYDNWRLSSARAHMALYMLVRAGVSEKRIERVEAYADHHLKLPSNPNGAENRRIEILVRKEKS
ncbi:MAG TPA: MotB family protein [Methylocella sp.]|nr:MotB family protein [Methylocella sp.]